MNEIPEPKQPTQDVPPVAEMPLADICATDNSINHDDQEISAVIDEAVAAAIPGSGHIEVDEAMAASIAATEAPAANEVPPPAQSPGPLDQQPPAQQPPIVQYADERPLGRICPAGEEYTGRWTREEQQRFIEGLERYGKEWKKVAAVVETRTIVQVRTHAQKFQKKLAKIFQKPVGEISASDFGAVTDSVGARNRLRVDEGELKRFEKLHNMFSTTLGGYGRN